MAKSRYGMLRYGMHLYSWGYDNWDWKPVTCKPPEYLDKACEAPVWVPQEIVDPPRWGTGNGLRTGKRRD